jgi:hypothetical protein
VKKAQINLEIYSKERYLAELRMKYGEELQLEDITSKEINYVDMNTECLEFYNAFRVHKQQNLGNSIKHRLKSA